MGDLVKANDIINKIIRTNPENDECYLNRAKIFYFIEGRPVEDCMHDLNRALSINPSNVSARLLRASFNLIKKNFKEGIYCCFFLRLILLLPLPLSLYA